MAGENKVLLHACCAICAGYPIEFLLAQDLKPIVFFSNDNIDTPTEFEKRKLALIELRRFYEYARLATNHEEQMSKLYDLLANYDLTRLSRLFGIFYDRQCALRLTVPENDYLIRIIHNFFVSHNRRGAAVLLILRQKYRNL